MPFASPTGRRVGGVGTPQRTPRARFNHRSLTSPRTFSEHGSPGGGHNMLEPLELVGSSQLYSNHSPARNSLPSALCSSDDVRGA